jgi:hypothetical protein
VLIGLLSHAASAQTASPLTVSITTNHSILQRNSIVHAKIKWGSVPDAKPTTLRGVQITLIRPHSKPNRCTLGDCIGASFSLPKQLTPKPGELLEFDIDLNALYWKDLISSQFDISQPKNLFAVVPAGTYSLLVSLSFRANYSTDRDPRVVTVSSNSVAVEMRR